MPSDTPPDQMTIQIEDQKMLLSCHSRSCVAIFLLPFAIIWSGGALVGSIMILTAEIPALFKLFVIPFIGGSILLWIETLMLTAGKINVTISYDTVHIFKGIGRLGRNKSYPLEILIIKENKLTNSRTSKKITFSKYLSKEQRTFIYTQIKKVKTDRADKRTFLNRPISDHLLE